MGLSLSRPIQSGMLVYCSCSPLLLWQTLDPRPSSVPSTQPWKPTMILIMVIIAIIHIMHIINIVCYYNNYVCYCNYACYCMFCFIGWSESVGSRVARGFRPSQFMPGILNLKNHLISGLNDYCKRKETPENGYLDSSRLVLSHFRLSWPREDLRLASPLTLAPTIPNSWDIERRLGTR